MKWEKIKKKYPKAYNKLCQNFNDGIGHVGINVYKELVFFEDSGDEEIISHSSLLEFFDKNNLNIHILPKYYNEGISWNWQIFWYLPKEEWYRGTEFDIYSGTMLYSDARKYNVRRKAEKTAFKKAFKILERRLENED